MTAPSRRAPARLLAAVRANPTLAAVSAEGFLTRLGFGMAGFALPLYALSLGMDIAEVGLLYGLRTAATLLVRPVMGWVADRIGRKHVTERSSVDMVFHSYRQQVPARELRDAGIESEPDGLSPDLGSELDLVAGLRAMRDLDVALTVGRFMPGAAFPGGEPNLVSKVEMKLAF